MAHTANIINTFEIYKNDKTISNRKLVHLIYLKSFINRNHKN